MKLLRHGPRGQEKPGLLDKAGRIRDLSGTIDDITPATLAGAEMARLAALDPESLPLVAGSPRLGVPISGIRQCIAIGLNYRQHAAESGMALPDEPVIFFKAISSISGPNDAIELPEQSEATDYEIELAIVIGKTAKRVSEADSLSYVAGYTIANDVSEREWQINHGAGQWCKGKSFETYCPLGPWLVTSDEIADPQALELDLQVNGKVRQHSNTADMIFNVRQLVSYCSRFMTLLAGDVIISGTPQGVGWAMKPRGTLKVGDKVRVAIAGLGEQEQMVRAAD